MKIFIKISLKIFPFLFILLISCSKTDIANPATTGTTGTNQNLSNCLISQESDISTWDYLYDSKKLITSMRSKTESWNFTYNTDNKLTFFELIYEPNNTVIWSYDVKYNGQNIDLVDRKSSTLAYRITLDLKGKIVKLHYTIGRKIDESVVEFEYDSNENLTKVFYNDGLANLNKSLVLEYSNYDTKNNYFYNIKGYSVPILCTKLFFISQIYNTIGQGNQALLYNLRLSKNNCKTVKTYSLSGRVDEATINYIENSDGTLKQLRRFFNGETVLYSGHSFQFKCN